jgi:hypothetical protein
MSKRLFKRLLRTKDYLCDLRTLKKQMRQAHDVTFGFGKAKPCLKDKCAESGTANGHYFHQDLLVATRVHSNAPQRHIDVGSRIDGLVAHIAAFREVEAIDIRALTTAHTNIKFLQADIMAPLRPDLINACDSLSCCHALEHFGLGRYGDPIRHDGHIVGLANLASMLQISGKLYFSVPIGPQRIEFNAHRVFGIDYLLKLFHELHLHLDIFSYVDDDGDLHTGVPLSASLIASNCQCTYGCGIFELTKQPE